VHHSAACLGRSLRGHGAVAPRVWRGHGAVTARSRRGHGAGMARSRRGQAQLWRVQRSRRGHGQSRLGHDSSHSGPSNDMPWTTGLTPLGAVLVSLAVSGAVSLGAVSLAVSGAVSLGAVSLAVSGAVSLGAVSLAVSGAVSLGAVSLAVSGTVSLGAVSLAVSLPQRASARHGTQSPGRIVLTTNLQLANAYPLWYGPPTTRLSAHHRTSPWITDSALSASS
jgi:hypothetical protein